jgi:hypothetical protein
MDRYIDRELIRFVHHLHDLNSDINGFSNEVQQDRIERWLDAVLPPDIEFEISDEDRKELRKAAE